MSDEQRLLQGSALTQTRSGSSVTTEASSGTIAEWKHVDALSKAAQVLLDEFQERPHDELVKEFLERTFSSFERSAVHRDGQLMTCWQKAPMDEPNAAQGAPSPRWGGAKTGGVSMLKFDEVQPVIAQAWEDQDQLKSADADEQPSFGPFDDTIYVIFVSPSDTDDYVAFGGKRVYWFDDDETKPTEYDQNGKATKAKAFLSYICYRAEDFPAATSTLNPTAPKALVQYNFQLDLQGYVTAQGRNMDVHRLPYRPKNDPGHVEASRVCVLLNALRELLNPESVGSHGRRRCSILQVKGAPPHLPLPSQAPHEPSMSHAACSSLACVQAAERQETVAITPEARDRHLAVAKRHGANSKVLNEDGETPSLLSRLDAPPPEGLKYRLGSGITLYLQFQEVMVYGFLVAGLLALPTIFANSHGGVLTSIGDTSTGATFSLGNRLPWSVRFWPTQFLDVVYSLVLMFAFSVVKRAVGKIDSDVDDGSATAADFTLYVHEVPPDLGAEPDDHLLAVNKYRQFFKELCQKKPRKAGVDNKWWLFGLDTEAGDAPGIPLDDEISEIVIVKNNGEWLKQRIAFKTAKAQAEYCEIKEQTKDKQGNPTGPPKYPLCGGEVSLGVQKVLGIVLGYSAEYYHEQASKAKEKMEALQRGTSRDEPVEVVALLVTFNSTDALDKVQYELHSTSLIGQLRALMFYFLRPFDGTCIGRMIDMMLTPLLAIIGDVPKFQHTGPDGDEIGYRLIVEGAVEPSDYIWENVTVSRASRMRNSFIGWLVMGLSIVAAVGINVWATASFGKAGKASGVFTTTDQKCYDVAYLRTDGAAEHCGLRRETPDRNWLQALNSGTGSPPPPFWTELAPTEADEAMGKMACGDEGGCGYAAEMGRLVRAMQCSAHPVTDFHSYAEWDEELASFAKSGGFEVSDADGNLLPECAFLNSPSADGTGFALGPPVSRDIFCNYHLNTTVLPYTMAAPYKCRASFGAAGLALDAATTQAERVAAQAELETAPGLSRDSGLADVVEVNSCDEPNCILCFERYTACADASAKTHTADELMDSSMQRKAASSASGLVIALLNTGLAMLASTLADKAKPISMSHKARSLMEKTFLLYAGNTLTSLLIINWNGMGKLGFYLTAGEQIYSLLISYGAIKLVTLWTVPPIMWVLNRWLLAPAALTQDKMNLLLEGYKFDYARSTAYLLFLVFIAACFSTVLPLSLFICAASCFLRYVTERIYFLHVYKQPPMYDSSLIKAAVSYLPVAIVGKVATMYYFYAETQAAEKGVLLLVAITVVWLTLSSKAMRALLLPCCLIKPLGPWKWVAQQEHDTTQDQDVAATVTHQTLKIRGQMTRYDPLVDNQAGSTLISRQSSALTVSALRPFIWINKDSLPEAVRDPNSGEDAHLPSGAVTATYYSDKWGEASWRRAARLTGAEEVAFFDSWEQVKDFINSKLRQQVSLDAPIGPCADSEAAAERFTYTGTPVALLPPVRRWGMLDMDESREGGWVLAFTRDRSEAPNLKWRLLEANTREEIHKEITSLLSVTRYIEGKGYDVWEVACVAAEQRMDPKGVIPPFTRWVAVLRAGGMPPVQDGRPTNMDRELDWCLEDTLDDIAERRMREGFALTCVAGTPPSANSRLLVFTRRLCSWASQRISITPDYPQDWIETQQARGLLIEQLAYCGESWTVVMAQSGDDRGTPLTRQLVMTDTEWPEEKTKALMRAGYRITAAARGPVLGFVIVFTKAPSSSVAACNRAFGSAAAPLTAWRERAGPDARAWHVDWCARETTKVHASSTAKLTRKEQAGQLLDQALAFMLCRQQTSDIQLPRASLVLDGDEGTCWRSDEMTLSENMQQLLHDGQELVADTASKVCTAPRATHWSHELGLLWRPLPHLTPFRLGGARRWK